MRVIALLSCWFLVSVVDASSFEQRSQTVGARRLVNRRLASKEDKEWLIENCYEPYKEMVEGVKAAKKAVKKGKVRLDQAKQYIDEIKEAAEELIEKCWERVKSKQDKEWLIENCYEPYKGMAEGLKKAAKKAVKKGKVRLDKKQAKQFFDEIKEAAEELIEKCWERVKASDEPNREDASEPTSGSKLSADSLEDFATIQGDDIENLQDPDVIDEDVEKNNLSDIAVRTQDNAQSKQKSDDTLISPTVAVIIGTAIGLSIGAIVAIIVVVVQIKKTSAPKDSRHSNPALIETSNSYGSIASDEVPTEISVV